MNSGFGIASALLFSLLSTYAFAQTSGTAAPPADPGKSQSMNSAKSDATFVKEATIGGMYEVEAGKVALANASSTQVKELAQHIVDDHTKAGDELKQIAQSKGITVPTALDSKHRKKVEKLQKKSGAEFDKAYAAAMVDDHKADIKAFEKEAKKGQDAALKQFAANTLPKLKEHLAMATAAKDATK